MKTTRSPINSYVPDVANVFKTKSPAKARLFTEMFISQNKSYSTCNTSLKAFRKVSFGSAPIAI